MRLNSTHIAVIIKGHIRAVLWPLGLHWIGLDRNTYHARLAELRRWADTVLRQHDGDYELRDCWPRHIHAAWVLSTLAAEWHHAYGGTRPDLARALEFYDLWLPGTMRRITGITGKCMPHCVMLRGPATGLLVPDTADTCAVQATHSAVTRMLRQG
jgi:hypothetical protein